MWENLRDWVFRREEKKMLKMKEAVDNKNRKFGSARYYYPCLVERFDGSVIPALFTSAQLADAIQRARLNPEDVPKGFVESRHWWRRLREWMKG